MKFLLGLDKEAEIYCRASIIGMKNQQDYVDKFVEEVTKNLKSMNIENYPYKEVIKAICSWVEESVKTNNWDIHDEDGVSWFMGMFCKSYVKVLNRDLCPYDKIFKDCFKAYFEDK